MVITRKPVETFKSCNIAFITRLFAEFLSHLTPPPLGPIRLSPKANPYLPSL